MANTSNRIVKTFADNKEKILNMWIEAQMTDRRIRGDLIGLAEMVSHFV